MPIGTAVEYFFLFWKNKDQVLNFVKKLVKIALKAAFFGEWEF